MKSPMDYYRIRHRRNAIHPVSGLKPNDRMFPGQLILTNRKINIVLKFNSREFSSVELFPRSLCSPLSDFPTWLIFNLPDFPPSPMIYRLQRHARKVNHPCQPIDGKLLPQTGIFTHNANRSMKARKREDLAKE